MVKISVSKAARMLGVGRRALQKQINSGKLQSYEGYITIDSLRLAYPNMRCDSELDKRIERMQQIKNDAVLKASVCDNLLTKNEQALMQTIDKLKSEIEFEHQKNVQHQTLWRELNKRLKGLEAPSDDTRALSQLKKWALGAFKLSSV